MYKLVALALLACVAAASSSSSSSSYHHKKDKHAAKEAAKAKAKVDAYWVKEIDQCECALENALFKFDLLLSETTGGNAPMNLDEVLALMTDDAVLELCSVPDFGGEGCATFEGPEGVAQFFGIIATREELFLTYSNIQFGEGGLTLTGRYSGITKLAGVSAQAITGRVEAAFDQYGRIVRLGYTRSGTFELLDERLAAQTAFTALRNSIMVAANEDVADDFLAGRIALFTTADTVYESCGVPDLGTEVACEEIDFATAAATLAGRKGFMQELNNLMPAGAPADRSIAGFYTAHWQSEADGKAYMHTATGRLQVWSDGDGKVTKQRFQRYSSWKVEASA